MIEFPKYPSTVTYESLRQWHNDLELWQIAKLDAEIIEMVRGTYGGSK